MIRKFSSFEDFKTTFTDAAILNNENIFYLFICVYSFFLLMFVDFA